MPPATGTGTAGRRRAPRSSARSVEALQRAPCLVSFSGGRDSSAVLAVAATVARREGLAAAGARSPTGSRRRADTDESPWQEQVVAPSRARRLGSGSRSPASSTASGRSPVTSCAGTGCYGRSTPTSTCRSSMRPPGGTVMSGIGGDEAFSPSSWARQIAVLTRADPASSRAIVLRVGLALSPAPLKAAYIRRRLPAVLRMAATRGARARAQAWVAADLAREPVRWRTRYRHLAGSAVIQAGLASLDVLAQRRGGRRRPPVQRCALPGRDGGAARRPQATLADRGAGVTGRRTRCPSALVRRSTKASFGEVFWGEQGRGP